MKSIWELDIQMAEKETLNTNLECDILVVGAGISGLLIGYKLANQGKNVVIIEKGRMLSGVTKNTTAKITIQHDLIYDYLIKNFGLKNAFLYAKANNEALRNYQELIEKEKIDCDFEIKDSYIYTTKKTNKIMNEYRACKKLDLDVELVSNVPLPIDIKLAIKMKNQAQFNPLKFLNDISKNLKIYENTRAVAIKDNAIITDKNLKIKANKIIVTTHYPFINIPGFYFLKMWQDRTYLIGLKGTKKVNGMYLDEDKKGLTFRDYKDQLIVGGFSHRTGKNKRLFSYKELKKKVNGFYPNSEITSLFSAQDCMTIDRIPYIGRYSPNNKNVYVATGFGKWGMTSSMLAANLLSDLINGIENDYEKLFSPERINLPSIYNFLTHSLESINSLLFKRLKIFEKRNSKIILKNKKVCTHLGCILEWNQNEDTWDCPCHGSRFTVIGKLIESPATKDLR